MDDLVVRPGRRPATSRPALAELGLALFDERGFDNTTVDDIAAEAGIGRRTFFRYFASKNDVVWGDFEAGLEALRQSLQEAPERLGTYEALLTAVLAFNRLDDDAVPLHRRRMELILHVPALQAHSTLRYAAWRGVLADFVAARRDEPAEAAVPQFVAHTMLAATLAGYEQWLLDPNGDLEPLLEQSLRRLGAGLTTLDGAAPVAPGQRT